MEDWQTDIQALLRDINGNYGDPKHEQSPHPLLPARSVSSSYKFQAEQSMVPRNALARISEQQLLYEAQLSRPLEANSDSPHNDNNLDPYGSCSKLEVEGTTADCCLDRALLDQPQAHSQRQANNIMRTLPAGRLSLSGDTAPHLSENASQPLKAQNQRRGRCGRSCRCFVADNR